MAGGRVLNVKHSVTIRSSSSQSPRQVWDRVAQAAASSSSVPPVPAVRSQERFPPLAASKTIPAFRQSQHATAWSAAGSSAPTSSSRGTSGIRPNTEGAPPSQATPPRMSTALFPTLPSSGYNNNHLKPAVSGNQSLKHIRGETKANAWSSGGEASPMPENHIDLQVSNDTSKGKKKKGKEKQTLFTLGTFPT